jgi:hypothetical protein
MGQSAGLERLAGDANNGAASQEQWGHHERSFYAYVQMVRSTPQPNGRFFNEFQLRDANAPVLYAGYTGDSVRVAQSSLVHLYVWTGSREQLRIEEQVHTIEVLRPDGETIKTYS